MTIKKRLYTIMICLPLCIIGCGQSESNVDLYEVIKQADGVSASAAHGLTNEQLNGYAVWCSVLARATAKAAKDYQDSATQDAFNRGWLLGYSTGS